MDGSVVQPCSDILTLTPLFYMMNVFDKAVSTGSIPTLVSLAAIGLFLYAMLAAMEWVRSLLMAHIAAKLDAAISPQLYQICFDSESGCVDTVGVGSQLSQMFIPFAYSSVVSR